MEHALVNQTPESTLYMDKVTILEAARLVDLPPNTVRKWRKTGKLKSAEKVLENNVETRIVNPQEVHHLANASRSTNVVNNRSYPDGQPNPEPDPTSPQATISPVVEQNLALWHEALVRPLGEANERQAAKLEQLSRENGELSAELRITKEHLAAVEAAQTARAAQVAPKPPPPAETPPAPEPPKKGVFGFFKRKPKEKS